MENQKKEPGEDPLEENDVIPINIAKDNALIDEDIENNSSFLNSFSITTVLCELVRNEKNHVFCTVNIFASLVMLYFGSNGTTFSDLLEFLGWKYYIPPFDDDTVLKTIKSVLQVFAYERFKLRPNYHLYNVFSLLMDKRIKLLDKYKTFVKTYFNVDIERIDFQRDWDLIAKQVNEFLKQELKLQDIKPLKVWINGQTQFVILNAVHFKGKWDIEFPSNDIKDEYFYNDGDQRTTVQMMAMFHRAFRYAFMMNWDSHVVEIPFASESLAFILILPKNMDGMDRLLDSLNWKSYKDTMKSLHSARCDIFLPKFKIECDYDFAKIFSDLKVFNTDRELTGIVGKNRIKVNNILHKVVFEINNNGFNPHTPDLTMLGRPRLIRADHPFVFLVKDNRTETIVFVGKVHSL